LPMLRTLRAMDMATVKRDELIEALAQRLETWGLASPAAFFLEANKPFSFIGSQALLFLQPIIGLLVGERSMREYALLLEERDNIDRLLARLEEGVRRP